jgi:uncharacterized protein
MYIKIHESYRKVVALCDKELIGKKFEEGKMQLDVRENFYKGKEITDDEITERLKDFKLDDSTFNIVGEKSVKAALDAGIITEGNIGKVDGIPFALSLL